MSRLVTLGLLLALLGVHSALAGTAWGAAPLADPAQPTALVAAHRNGQTFLTWTQSVDAAVERYRIYRHDQPIDAQSLGQAKLLVEQWRDSSLFRADRWYSPELDTWQPRHFERYVISPGGSELPATTELLVWTVAAQDFHGGVGGDGYYAVTSVDDQGTENLTDFGPDNAVGPVTENVATPQPVLGTVLLGGKCEIYIQYLDIREFNETLLAPNEYNDWFGLSPSDPVVANDIEYAVTFALFLPSLGPCSGGATEFPTAVTLHGYGGVQVRPWTFDPNPTWCNVLQVYPLDVGDTWWFGCARDHDYRTGLTVPPTDTVENFTERWVLAGVESLLASPVFGESLDPERVFVLGHSMGGSGALALALRYPQRFAGAHASQPMTNYLTSGSGGGTNWVSDVEIKWGQVADALPISLDAPDGLAADLLQFNGLSVWDWQNHQLQLVTRRGADFVPLGIDHGIPDTIIEWSTQGQPAYAALDQSSSCWAGEVTNSGHTTSFQSTLPGALQDDPFGVPFAGWQVVLSESVPGLSETTGPPLPPTAVGTYNDGIDWSASWNDWDGAPLDEPDRWQISLRTFDSTPLSTRVTPRRLQAFEVEPGVAYRWSHTDVLTGTELESGTLVADADGLLTTPSVVVTEDGNRIRFEQSLSAATGTISVATGGSQELELACGADLAGELFWVLGSLAGTSPGPVLDGVTVPLVQDAYFDLTLASPNSPLLAPSLAALDGDGRATCTFSLPADSSAALAGATVHHAFVALDLPGTGVVLVASNPVSVDLEP